MRVLFYTLCNQDTGMGHWIRCLALLNEVRRRGEITAMVTDKDPGLDRAVRIFPVKKKNRVRTYRSAVEAFVPDWVVVDLPDEVPTYVFEYADKARVCAIDGIGHNIGDKADLLISQSPDSSEYCAPDYLILRPGLFKRHYEPPATPMWFVYGGASDPMGLLPAYQKAMRDTWSLLLTTNQTPDPAEWYDPNIIYHWQARSEGDQIFDWMIHASHACVHMGMAVWELVALGVPTYVFSRAERHLETALKIQELGLVKAWPHVGLPSPDAIRTFLREPFEVSEDNRPDGKGVERIVDLWEDE